MTLWRKICYNPSPRYSPVRLLALRAWSFASLAWSRGMMAWREVRLVEVWKGRGITTRL